MDNNCSPLSDDMDMTIPPLDWDNVKMSDLFLDNPPIFAQVELVDNPEAIVRAMMYELLTELLCEV